MKKSSKSQTALVTGGAKRLGHATALHLAAQGYNIALHYHESKSEAVKTAQAIGKKGVRCALFSCDLADEHGVRQLVPQVYREFKNLNVLINSASIFVPNQFGDQDLTLFNSHWNINFKAPYLLSCAFNRLVKQGQIINLIDTNVVKYETKHADYLLAKKALNEFTKMAAVQWGPRIRVNGIAPGMILPPIDRRDDRKQRAAQIPLQKVGDPRYIVSAVQFLLDNDYMTGQVLAIDGGEGLI